MSAFNIDFSIDYSTVNPLRVDFSDGTTFGGVSLDRHEWETFRNAIIHIGIENIRKKYNPTYDGEALILHKRHSNYPESSRELDDYYFLNTHGGAEYFKKVLEDIGNKLNIGIKVNILKT
jgi:hypothetical protein